MSAIDIKQLGLNTWGPEQMAKPENFNLVEILTYEFALTLNPGDTNVLYLTLTELLNKNQGQLNNQLLAKYQILAKQLGILSWINRKEDEIKDYLTSRLLFIFKRHLPLFGLIVSIIRWYRWEYANILQRYQSYLRENLEVIGLPGKNFIFNNKPGNPTIKNWLDDYIIFSGSPQNLSGLALIKYFSESQNVKLLNLEEINLLKKILRLYNILTNPFANSNFFQNPELFDNELAEAPEELTVNLGSEDTLKQATDLYQTTLVNLQQKYQFSRGREIYKNYTVSQLKDLLLSERKSPAIVLPILSLLAVKDGGLKILEIELASVLTVSTNPKFRFKEILNKLLLECGLTEVEAAVYVMHLAGLNKQLVGLTYIDLKTLTFKWR